MPCNTEEIQKIKSKHTQPYKTHPPTPEIHLHSFIKHTNLERYPQTLIYYWLLLYRTYPDIIEYFKIHYTSFGIF